MTARTRMAWLVLVTVSAALLALALGFIIATPYHP